MLLFLVACLTEAAFYRRLPDAFCAAAERCGEMSYDACMWEQNPDGRSLHACTDGGGTFLADAAEECLQFYEDYVCDGTPDGAMNGGTSELGQCPWWCEPGE